jgi:hypothetical protein
MTFLRGLGVLNASIWFGAAIFFTFFAGPAIFSEPLVKFLTRPGAGIVAQVLVDRYFTLSLACGLVAFGHLIGESLYLGRPFLRLSLSLLAALFALVLVGGYGIQPKLKQLHRTMYLRDTPEPERQAAQRSFRIWHGVSQVLNLIVVGGVAVYLIRVAQPGDATRYRI